MTEPRASYPEQLAIRPLDRPPSAAVEVPGSKSITNRALVLAALAQPVGSTLTGALRSEDTEIMVGALRALGFGVETDWDAATIHVRPGSPERPIPAAEANLFVGNSGTSMRFLVALVAAGKGRYRLDGVPRMRERPIADLLDGLQHLGANAYSEKGNGFPPVIVEADGITGCWAPVLGKDSSQFLSGLLLVAPMSTHGTILEVTGPLVSRPYIEMTVEMMRQFGAMVGINEDRTWFDIPAGHRYQARNYAIEPDASAASYFFAAAAITGGRVTVLGIPEKSLQGDVAFVDVLARMGCRVVRCSAGVTVHGRLLCGVDVDMNDISDTVMTLAAVACFADGPTTIRNVAHIRHKETDRLRALATELRRLGAGVDEYPDGLRITPGPLHGTAVDTYNDHRMAMSLALVGLRVPGVVIRNPGCVAKTYPDFFTDLERLRP